MKAIFESETGATFVVGVEPNNTLSLNTVELSLSEAYLLQRYINTCLHEMERSERTKLPIFKRWML
jgi:hypothetical protein